jgi:hypothetical protein
MTDGRRRLVIQKDGVPIAVMMTRFGAEEMAAREGGVIYDVPVITKDVKLTPELLAQLLSHDPKTGKLYWKSRSRDFFDCDGAYRRFHRCFAGKEAVNSVNSHGYLVGKVLRLPAAAHRVIWALEYGRWPDGQIDHIDGDRANNRISNLRDVSQAENTRNAARPHLNTTGRIGVSFKGAVRAGSKKWIAHIGSKPIKSFHTFEEACAAREEAEQRLGYHPNHGRDGLLKTSCGALT